MAPAGSPVDLGPVPGGNLTKMPCIPRLTRRRRESPGNSSPQSQSGSTVKIGFHVYKIELVILLMLMQ